MRGTVLAALAALGLAGGAAAGEWTFGLGAADYTAGSGETHVEFEARTDPFARLLGSEIAGQAGVTANGDGAWFAGAGLAALADLGPAWFAEASLMAGYYEDGGPGTDLGNDIEFRSLLGLGRRVGEATRVSLAVSHISNAGLDDLNPGVNMLTLRLTREF